MRTTHYSSVLQSFWKLDQAFDFADKAAKGRGKVGAFFLQLRGRAKIQTKVVICLL